MKKQPLVSINIRTYNSGKTLAETLLSIKKQSYKNIEMLISDGYSKDNSVEIAHSFGAIVNFEEKLGDARYKNYKKTKGSYLFSVDSDQVVEPEVVTQCVHLCEDKGFDAVTIREESLITKGTLIEKLIAYDKWVIDKNRADDAMFGTACPRFFKKSIFDRIEWPKGLSVFDDTILYMQLVKMKTRIAYLSRASIRHHEVTTWSAFIKKFFRYGKGYVGALKAQPTTIAAHSLPRASYFSLVALSKPHYFLGLLLLYVVKAISAGAGVLAFVYESKKNSR